MTALITSFALQPCYADHLCFSLPGVERLIQIPRTCMFRLVTGIPCPGCGLTRSFVAISHGDIRAAWEFNAMGPILYLLCILQIPYRPIEYLGLGRNSRTWARCKQRFDLIVWVMLVGFILAWVAKLAV